jgi:hypothetical protein
MRLLAAPLLILLAGGCATVPPANAGTTTDEEQPPRVEGEGRCDAKPAQHLVGRTRNGEIGTEALRLSGARTLRWIPEGTMVTMDYREDRLNIDLDRSNRITRIRCG